MTTKERVEDLLKYREGKLYWRKLSCPKSRVVVGSEAGWVDSCGYIKIAIDGKTYQAHHLVYLMFKGYIPKTVDHIDTNRENNKIENLRECTRQENCMNRSIHPNNTSGTTGVFWNKNDEVWHVKIGLNYKRLYLGSFKDKNEAISVALNAYNEHYGDFCHNRIKNNGE